MDSHDLYRQISQLSDTKIVLLVLDGLGGLPMEPGGLTELEAARTPNLDQLATRSVCGLHNPVGHGIIPGSGPGHLALFGYDPLRFQIGRGVLEALGIDLALRETDLAARGNLATMDSDGIITDRRAGRIETAKTAQLCRLLADIKLPGVQVLVEPVKEHRFVVVFRGDGLSDQLTESDPQRVGERPLKVGPTAPEAQATAKLVDQFVRAANAVLAGLHPANTVLLRGFAKYPQLPTMQDIFGLRPAVVATYPMYRGLAKLIGMTPLPTGETFQEEIAALAANYAHYDFFFIHFKKTDSAGEDGDFVRKVRAIEEVDAHLPGLLALHPDVLVVTGDHSTPSLLRAHSWHPVPVLLSSRYCRPDGATEFSERACARGGLGILLGKELMPLAMAHALKFAKYGA